MPTPEQFDVLIVGAGQCGVPLARALARAGRRTALIEREHVGGTCINEGCTPTKTMVASARVAYIAGRSADYGVVAGPVSVDMARVRDRKRQIVDSFRGSSERRLQSTENLTLIAGEARFTSSYSLTVDTTEGVRNLTAQRIVIDTGGRPAVPDLPGLDRTPFLNSTTIMELGAVPQHLIVLGGGYIALEFAQMFRRFGSHITLIQRGEHLMSREDDDVAEEVRKILVEDGVDIFVSTPAVRVEGETGSVGLTVRSADGERIINGTHLLVATGRTPNTDRLHPDAAGIAVDDRGFIPVSDCLETNVPGIYAVGDVNGGPAFTHISYDDFRILKSILIDDKPSSTAGRLLPYVVYIDPQLGRVGITEAQARDRGIEVQIAKMPMSDVARALETDETRGFIKVIVDKATGRILGVAVLGIEGGEIMSALQIAMMGCLPIRALREGIFAHPTLMESLNNLFALPAPSG